MEPFNRTPDPRPALTQSCPKFYEFSIPLSRIIHGGFKIHKLAFQSEFHKYHVFRWKRKVVPVSAWIKPPAIENKVFSPIAIPNSLRNTKNFRSGTKSSFTLMQAAHCHSALDVRSENDKLLIRSDSIAMCAPISSCTMRKIYFIVVAFSHPPEIHLFSIPDAESLPKHFCALISLFCLPLSVPFQDHHDDIRQEQKWEMQALSSSQSSNGSPDDSNEHNSNGHSETSSSCETGTPTESSSCGNQVENGTGSSQHINNNTIAINNNNCDTIKNNNQTVTAATPLEISTVNDVEAVPAVALIEQQNALLRGVNIGMRVH